MGVKNKRGEDKQTPRRKTNIMLSLLEEMTGKPREVIRNNFIYHKRKTSEYSDVIRYIEKFMKKKQALDNMQDQN